MSQKNVTRRAVIIEMTKWARKANADWRAAMYGAGLDPDNYMDIPRMSVGLEFMAHEVNASRKALAIALGASHGEANTDNYTAGRLQRGEEDPYKIPLRK